MDSNFLGMSQQDQPPLDFLTQLGETAKRVAPDLVSKITASQTLPGLSPAPGFKPGVKGSKSSNQAKSEATNKLTQNTNYDADQFGKLTDIVRSTPEIQDQSKSLDAFQRLIGGMGDVPIKGNSWVSPLLALADAQTGSHMAADYKPGLTQEDMNNTMLKYGDELQKRRGDLSKQVMEGVTKLKSGTDQNSTMNQLAMMTGMNLASNKGGPTASNELAWHKQLNDDKDIATANAAMSAAGNVQNLLALNTTQSNFLASIGTLRSSGLNRLNQVEIQSLAGGDKALGERVSQALETLQSGGLTPENAENLRQASVVFAQEAPKLLEKKRAEYDELGKDIVPDVKRKNVLNEKFYRSTPAPAVASTAPAAPDFTKMTNDQIKEHIKANGG